MNRKSNVASRTPPGQATPYTLPLVEAPALSRRAILRGALAAGCTLLLPASLLGCSKKEAGTSATEPAVPSPDMATPASPSPMESTAPASPAPMESAAPAKVSQASVKYQTEPKGDQQCSNCLHFVPESNTCKVVEGTISPTGWCIIWTKLA